VMMVCGRPANASGAVANGPREGIRYKEPKAAQCQADVTQRPSPARRTTSVPTATAKSKTEITTRLRKITPLGSLMGTPSCAEATTATITNATARQHSRSVGRKAESATKLAFSPSSIFSDLSVEIAHCGFFLDLSFNRRSRL
jgi:hypothetical protein